MEGGTNRFGRYQDLFAAPTGSELEARYQQIAGGGYKTMHPTLAALADAASSSTLRDDSEAAKEICDESVRLILSVACVHKHTLTKILTILIRVFQIYESMDLDDVCSLNSNPHACY